MNFYHLIEDQSHLVIMTGLAIPRKNYERIRTEITGCVAHAEEIRAIRDSIAAIMLPGMKGTSFGPEFPADVSIAR